MGRARMRMRTALIEMPPDVRERLAPLCEELADILEQAEEELTPEEYNVLVTENYAWFLQEQERIRPMSSDA